MVVAPRLDNVLKRAEELEKMDKSTEALDSLYETLVSKRARSLSLPQLETLFTKFIQLSVELRRGKFIKDGLHQYKKLALASGPEGVQSLVRCIDHLLAISEEAVAKAQQQAEEVQVDDLEEENPHDLLMAMVNSEEAKDRTDREVVTPWLKLLWENYRSVLDVLRNHSQLEVAYANVASQAFHFCAKYGRKTEFRRLAELIRTHLQYAATQSKHYHADLAAARAEAIESAGSKDITAEQIEAHMPATAAQFPIDLSDPDTLQRFLDTRFEQLNIAVELELWQEAFRSVEDVHSLFTVTHRGCPVGSMGSYYNTLAKVFAVSNNYLFHAATWFRYFSVLSSRRGPADELRRIASLCILSVLCISRSESTGSISARARRWMSLINLQVCPTRESLIETVVSKNVLRYAQPELRDLFNLLEQNFDPLSLKDELSSLLPALSAIPYFESYSKRLSETIASSIYEDLAISYSETKLDFVIGLATLPAPLNASKTQLERLLVSGSANRYQVRINHQKGVVRFVDSLAYPLEGTAGASVRSQLFELAKCFVDAPGLEFGKGRVAEVDSSTAFKEENARFLDRKQREAIISEKEKTEKLLEEEERKREQRREAERIKLEEEERANKEALEQSIMLQNKEIEGIKRAEKLSVVNSINAMGYTQIDLKDVDNMDYEQLQKVQVEQVTRETENINARMAAVARRYDHLERAIRLEEAKIWQDDAAKQAERDRLNHERRSEALVTGARNAYELTQSYVQRMGRVRPHYDNLMAKVQSKHDKIIAKKREENAKLLADAKAKRTAEVEERRALEEKRKAAEAKIAEERRKADEIRAEKARRLREMTMKTTASAATPAPAPSAPSAPAPAPAAAAPAPSPFGAARPVKVDPFGRASAGAPASGVPAGGARAPPAASRPQERSASSPFGNARAGAPATGSRNAARPAGAESSNVFGKATPAPASSGSSSVFGKATPTSSGSASLFGKAKPITPPTDGAAKTENAAPAPTKGKFIPSYKRRQMEQN